MARGGKRRQYAVKKPTKEHVTRERSALKVGTVAKKSGVGYLFLSRRKDDEASEGRLDRPSERITSP